MKDIQQLIVLFLKFSSQFEVIKNKTVKTKKTMQHQFHYIPVIEFTHNQETHLLSNTRKPFFLKQHLDNNLQKQHDFKIIFINFYSSIVALPCCVSFYCTSK